MKIGEFVKKIIFIVASMHIVIGGFQLYDLSKLYNENSNIILEQHKNENTFLHSFEAKGENKSTFNLFLFSGNMFVRDIKQKNSSTIIVNSKIKTGDIKALLVETSSGHIITERILDNDQVKIEVSPGEYQIFLIGKMFIGKVSFEFDDARRTM